jgi:hypothetical protein
MELIADTAFYSCTHYVSISRIGMERFGLSILVFLGGIVSISYIGMEPKAGGRK